jgi:hypothetical protein
VAASHDIQDIHEFLELIVAAPDATALQRSDLNQFLFADIGTEANGMTLSVLSVFARQGTDPWTEADRLAILPKAAAADSLARMIAAMPRSLWPLPDALAIAVRLTGLLPARPTGIIPSAGIRQAARRWSIGQIALVSASTALIIAFAIMMMKQ